MSADIQTAFKDLLNCLQALKMYGPKHPMYTKSLDNTYIAFESVFSTRQEMVIGIVGEELAFEKEILFDLSKFLRPSILYLKERNIERLGFLIGLTKEELENFVSLIARPKEVFKGDPQEMLTVSGINHIKISKLKVDDENEEKAFGLAQLSLYDSSADKVNQALSGVLNSEQIDHLALKFSLNNILENLDTQRNELLKLATLKRYDVETYTHMLNVSIFSMYFASRLGFDKADVLDIGVAAMFHDIGKISISRKILHKAGKLSDSEFGSIKSHTILGAEIMLKYVDTLGMLPVVVSFEHHLKYDSSGYPRLPLLRKQHIASSIVSICDVYDALSQRRSYKQDYSPDLVYNIMNRNEGGSFDPQLLDKFFKFLGLWPVGAVVALSDESIAIVKEENESDIRRPKVEVVSPVEKRRLVDLAQDNSLSIQRYLNPWKEGKEFLHLPE
ncbi:MAG: HD domain-containing protein [Candidatus Omnitrophica bacterium]|nr:HD domain-containing protein [Candidatus Omnitrophota bacterium]